jgi:hypothetical protein
MLLNNKDFYPTPVSLLDKMFSGLKTLRISTVLEPSAGAGDMADFISYKFKICGREKDLDLDTVELDEQLTHILKGKKYKVVHDDFMTYSTYKSYDLIAMNPPFSNGDKHLLRAIEMQKYGGQIVCILNAETLRNTFSNTRKDLARKLQELDADIEYLQNEFTDAKRKTGVEIALIKIDIPYEDEPSVILDHLKKAKDAHGELEDQNDLMDGDVFKVIVEQYDFEVSACVKLINEFYTVTPKFLKDFAGTKERSILSLTMSNSNSNYMVRRDELLNDFIKEVRYKYWKAFFQFKDIRCFLTEKLQIKYQNKLQELRDYEFSLRNIYTLRLELHKEMSVGVEECIIELFDYLSYQYSYAGDGYSKNIHYFNGWKTNKSWIINKKVIVPLNAWGNIWGYNPRSETEDKLLDIEKSLNYLAHGTTSSREDSIDLSKRLDLAKKESETKNIQLNYFKVTFFKKGTCHIEFTDLELLKKLNIFGSQKKKWLPPAYGKAKYKDMTKEEKAMVDEFEGKGSYDKMMKDPKHFIYNASEVMRLN